MNTFYKEFQPLYTWMAIHIFHIKIPLYVGLMLYDIKLYILKKTIPVHLYIHLFIKILRFLFQFLPWFNYLKLITVKKL